MENIKIKDLYNTDRDYIKDIFNSHEYPWEILPLIKDILSDLIKNGYKDYTYLKDDVLIGKNVTIYPTATINGPCIIGDDTEIRPGAFIRGNAIIGDKCVIGNSTEIKNAILLDHVDVPHYNYVGDSILGNYAHMGAGSICSNFRGDGKNIIIHSEKDYETGLRKTGAFLGDHADIGCGSVLNPGTIVGSNTQVYPTIMLRGVYPSNSIIKTTKSWVAK